MFWTGGTINSGSVLTITTNSALNLSGSATKTLNGTLTNAGSLTWSGAGGLTINAPFYNLAGATFEAQNDQALGPTFCCTNMPFYNAGLLRKTAGTNTTSFNILGETLINSGTVDVRSGTLMLNGGGTNSGLFTVSAGATNLLASSYTFLPGSQATGAGTHLWTGGSGGTITLNTTVAGQDVEWPVPRSLAQARLPAP